MNRARKRILFWYCYTYAPMRIGKSYTGILEAAELKQSESPSVVVLLSMHAIRFELHDGMIEQLL